MSFVQQEFVVLMTVVWALYWRLGRRLQNLLLLIAGALFYGWVHPWFLIPLYTSALLDFLCARAMEDHPEHRRRWLTLSLAGNLGMLGYFKYAGWFVHEIDAVLSLFGLGGLPALHVVLPVGISFYTFQTMSYSIDVFRGKVKARRDLLDFVVFVSFFPQLVAGPIERAADLLPQVERERTWAWQDQREGLALVFWGAFKKIALADTLAPWVERIYGHPDPDFWMIWTGTFCFSVQLLADFSGYTDIARGTGRMLGFTLSENFLWPYMSATPMEAWRRFHRTLGAWMTDYVFLPMASSRWIHWVKIPGVRAGGRFHLARVTFLTFVASGLWHGAAWNFLLWGMYLGLLQIGYAEVERRLPRRWRQDARWRWLTVPLMYQFHLGSLLLIRSRSLDEIGHHLAQLPFAGTEQQATVATGTLGLTLACATPLVLMMLAEWYVIPRISRSPWFLPLQTSGWALQAAAIWLMAQPTATDFLYFHF